MEKLINRINITKKNGFIIITFFDKHLKKYYHFPSLYVWKDYKSIILEKYPRKEGWLYADDLLNFFNGLLIQYPKSKVISCRLNCLSLDKGYGHSYGFSNDQFEDGSWSLKSFVKGFNLLYKSCSDEYFIVDNLELILVNGKQLKKSKRSHIPKGIRHEVFKRDNYTCVECGAKKEDGVTLHIDHILPVSQGGTDELDNLQTLCAKCNLNKSDVYQKINRIKNDK